MQEHEKTKVGRKKKKTKEKAQINRNKTRKEEKGHWASMNLQAQQPKKNNERNPKNRLNSKQNKAQMKTRKDRKLHKLFVKLFKLGPSKSLGPFILMDYAMPLKDNKATQLLHEGWVPP